MATARDVAELAGTSTAVVSYVFNNGPRNVAAATRERVLKAATELNYRPNVFARGLKAGQTRSTGLIVPDITNPFFAELARHVEEAAAERGNILLIADSAQSRDQEARHRRALFERRVDSVVMVSVSDAPDISDFVTAGIPVLSLQPVDDGVVASTVTINFEAAAATATRHLVDHGYRDLRIMLGPSDGVGLVRHRRGFEKVVSEAGATGGEWRSEISRFEASRVAQELLRAGDRPRAIYATTDEQAIGVLHAAYALGLRVPDDLAVIGLDGTKQGEVTIPPLTTVRQPLRAMAEEAMDLLADAHGEQHRVQSFTFEIRQSCGHH